jgi:hypothetical protein
MAFPLTLPSTNPPSTNWGGTVNANWTTLNSAFQTQALFTGTTSATSPITGSVIIGNGTSATSIGMGAGNIYAGNCVNAAFVFTSNTDTTTTTGVSALGNNLTLLAAPTAASTAAYVGLFLQSYATNANLAGGGVQGLNLTSGISTGGSGSSSLAGTYGIISAVSANNSGPSGSSVTLAAATGIEVVAALSAAVAGSTATISTYIGLLLSSPVLSGSGTKSIVSNYGVYQQDPAASNFFAGPSHFGTDPGGSDPLRVGGALTISDTKMMTTMTAFANGAGVSQGNLLNAPVAGNPSKWIPINDNGTTRYIPAW